MAKVRYASVNIYEMDKQLKAMAQFNLDDIILERDDRGAISLKAKIALQKALEDALSKWEIE
jgi:hypothetical protein